MKVRIKKEYLNKWSPINDEVYEIEYSPNRTSYSINTNLGCRKYPKYERRFMFHMNWLIIIEQ